MLASAISVQFLPVTYVTRSKGLCFYQSNRRPTELAGAEGEQLQIAHWLKTRALLIMTKAAGQKLMCWKLTVLLPCSDDCIYHLLI